MRSAQKVSPFYEEWWFLVVIALVGLIFILLLVFILIIRGQSKKYTKKADSGEEHSVPLESLHSPGRELRVLTIAHLSVQNRAQADKVSRFHQLCAAVRVETLKQRLSVKS